MGRFIDQRLIDDRTDGNKTDERGGLERWTDGQSHRSLLTDTLAVMALLCCHGNAVTYQLGRRRDAQTRTHTHTFLNRTAYFIQ